MASGGGALFSVVWGLGATGFGWVVATNFRGAADRFLRLSQRSVPFGRGRPAPVSVGFVRVLAGVFALIGPVMLVVGVLGVLDGQWSPGRFPELPLFMAVAMVVVTAVSLWTFWRQPGMLRREWAAGGALQRTACAVATAAVLGFPATMAIGDVTAMLIDWLVGGLACLLLLVAGRADRDGEPETVDT